MKTTKMMAIVAVLVFGVMFSTGVAQAGLIDPSTITATASSTYSGRDAAHTVDNSGMSDSALPHTVNYSVDTSKPTQTNSPDGFISWANATSVIVGQWLTFTFSTAQTIGEFAEWNANAVYSGTPYTNCGIRDLYIATSTDGTSFGANQVVPAGYTGAGTTTWTFAEGDASNSDPGGGFILSTNWTNVKAVRFTVQSNWGGPVLAGDLTLNEVRFYTPLASSVPEPAGLGLIGLALLAVRRRRA